MSASPIHDTSLERRRIAAATVAQHLQELRSILGVGDHPVCVVDGSAVAVELRLSEADTRCYAIRVAVFVAPRARRDVELTLLRAGFRVTTPSSDGPLLRLARRHGRRPVHVLFDAAGQRSDDVHPSAPEAARARSARMASAWLEPVSTFCRTCHDAEDAREITESFEVQLIERVSAAGAPTGTVGDSGSVETT